jgi:hypothetical protein
VAGLAFFWGGLLGMSETVTHTIIEDVGMFEGDDPMNISINRSNTWAQRTIISVFTEAKGTAQAHPPSELNLK